MLAEAVFYIPSLGRALQDYATQLFVEAERGIFAFNTLNMLGENMPPSSDLEDMEDMGDTLAAELEAAMSAGLIAETGWEKFAVDFDSGRSIYTGTVRDTMSIRHVDLRQDNLWGLIGHSFQLVFGPDTGDLVRFTARSDQGNAVIDVWLDKRQVVAILRGYSIRILLVSLAISFFSAALVYFALRWLIVRPIGELRMTLSDFAKRPQDPAALLPAGKRQDEIGFIQAETRAMQLTLAKTLQQRERLAALGGAVAQVNHDLRGMLSTALLLSDSLETSDDPKVAKAAPVLAQSIEKAVDLCSATLRFAKGEAPKMDLAPWDVAEAIQPLIDEWQVRWPDIQISQRGEDDVAAKIDQLALHRALDNLARNAAESGTSSLHIVWCKSGDTAEILLTDTGPGLSDQARENLFVPFAGSTKPQGTGLGVTNAADLIEAMGGRLNCAAQMPAAQPLPFYYPYNPLWMLDALIDWPKGLAGLFLIKARLNDYLNFARWCHPIL